MSLPAVPGPVAGERRRPHIGALTGIRGIAALWVLSFHFRPEIVEVFPQLGVLTPVMNVGHLGVDLFFLLSGFILTITHLDNMSAGGFSVRAPLAFLWLRLSRVWPLTAFCLLIWGVYNLAKAFWLQDPSILQALTPGRLLEHLLLVQAWTPEHHDWNPVDWSVSAEWMAYLAFAIGVFVLGKFVAVTSVRTRVIVAFLCLVPIVSVGVSLDDGSDLLWNNDSIIPGIVALRVLSEFVAGSLVASVVMRSVQSGARSRLPVPTVVLASILLILACMQRFDPWLRPRFGTPWSIRGHDMWGPSESAVVIPLFLVLIASLALCRDPLERLLSGRFFIWLGKISFALYLIHWLFLDLMRTLVARLGLQPDSALVWPYRALLLGAIALAVASGWLLWRYVEEPARKLMRGMTPKGVKV